MLNVEETLALIPELSDAELELLAEQIEDDGDLSEEDHDALIDAIAAEFPDEQDDLDGLDAFDDEDEEDDGDFDDGEELEIE